MPVGDTTAPPQGETFHCCLPPVPTNTNSTLKAPATQAHRNTPPLLTHTAGKKLQSTTSPAVSSLQLLRPPSGEALGPFCKQHLTGQKQLQVVLVHARMYLPVARALLHVGWGASHPAHSIKLKIDCRSERQQSRCVSWEQNHTAGSYTLRQNMAAGVSQQLSLSIHLK